MLAGAVQPVASSRPTALTMVGGSQSRKHVVRPQAVGPQSLQPVALTQPMASPQVSACLGVFYSARGVVLVHGVDHGWWFPCLMGPWRGPRPVARRRCSPWH